MNDFTIEELQQISFCLYAYPHPEDDLIYSPLRAKIKSMIDKYCEHDWNYNQHDMPIDCAKCGKSYP